MTVKTVYVPLTFTKLMESAASASLVQLTTHLPNCVTQSVKLTKSLQMDYALVSLISSESTELAVSAQLEQFTIV